MRAVLKPKVIVIDANASCQLRCPTCPTTSKGYPPVVGCGYLKSADFKKLLIDNPIIRSVSLNSRGEMFLNPELLSIVEWAFANDIPLSSDSGVNLNHAGAGVLEALVRCRFRSLCCSIDGATPETYCIYRIGGDFNRVIYHVRQINQYKRIYKSKYPRLIWQFVVFGHNEHELPMAKQLAAELGMGFQAKMSWDSSYSPIRNKGFVMREAGWQAGTREEFASLKGANYMRGVCFSLWHSPRINWDGKVLGCCWNSWQEFGGNVFKDGYIACANGENIDYARRMLLGRSPHRDDLPCSACKLYSEMRQSGRYLTESEIFGSLLYRLARAIYRGVRS